MKTQISIITGLVIFITVLTSGCNKEDDLLLNQNNEVEKTSILTEKTTSQKADIVAIFDNLAKNKKIISITENYTDKELGITGTLYVIDKNGENQEWLLTDKEPNLPKGGVPRRRSVVATYDDVVCTGFDEYDCFGWKKRFVVY